MGLPNYGNKFVNCKTSDIYKKKKYSLVYNYILFIFVYLNLIKNYNLRFGQMSYIKSIEFPFN